jgi:hypothetical protein
MFVTIAAEWRAAGIEMTDEVMAAALQLARTRVEKQRREVAAIAGRPEKRAPNGDAIGGVVYYFRRGKYVKIGTTINLKQRMRELVPDQVLAVEPGSYKLERQLHTRFRRDKCPSLREYFLLSSELQAHIDGVIEKHGPPPSGLSELHSDV